MITVRPVADQDEQDSALLIRFEVFVDEQKCPAEDEVDHYDADALHFIAFYGEAPAGTARLIDRGDGVVKIGRVAVRAACRRQGVGRALMAAALAHAQSQGFHGACLDAQTYAISFYESLGFVAEGPEFDDAGIAHRHMSVVLPQGDGGATE